MAKRYWLLKTEPGAYSIDDLERDGTTSWSGVRNYQARNLMRDEMKPGDEVLFYHSSTSPPGVVGLARIASGGYPDPWAADPDSPYFDEKHTEDEPRWYTVDVSFVRKFARMVELSEIKEMPELSDMLLVNRSRLSVQPVAKAEFERVKELGKK